MSNTDDKWSFADNFTWGNTYPRCNAKNQSPINIDTETTQHCKSLCSFKTIYKPSKCYVNYSNNLIRIKYSSGSYLEYQNILYELKEITIHVPTLHSIDNSKYDLEICMIHNLSGDNKTTTTSDTPNGIMLCRLFESGPHYGSAETFINQVINEIPKESINYDKEVEVSKDWGANLLMPENKSFYMYDGSLPFPPCDVNYKVIVYEDIGRIGRTNLDIFKLNLGENVRFTQDIGDRIVMYNPYYKKDSEPIKGVISTNKFLKCSENPLKKLLVEPEGTTQTTSPIEDGGISVEIKSYLKQIFLLVLVIILLVNAIIFVKYLFKNYHAQNLLALLVGKYNLIGVEPDWNSDNCQIKRDGSAKTSTSTSSRVDKYDSNDSSDSSEMGGMRGMRGMGGMGGMRGMRRGFRR
jgi:carbonic anhydrase